MSSTVPQDTSQPALSAMPEESTAGSMPLPRVPLRARLKLIHQRIILFVRWCFRLEIDDIKERNTQAQIDALLEICQRQMEAFETIARVSNNIQARLKWYETNIPRMRELKREYDRAQEKLKQSTNGNTEHAERLAHGIVGAIRQ